MTGVVVRVLGNRFIAKLSAPGPVSGSFEVTRASDGSSVGEAMPVGLQDASNCLMQWWHTPTTPVSVGDKLQSV